MNCLLQAGWPEPVVRVQHLSDSGIQVVPERYVKRPSDRPGPGSVGGDEIDIPVVDMEELYSGAKVIAEACQEWGFFQVVNHGVSHALMRRVKEAWREFFRLPLEEKQAYANMPTTYEGYGSRLGVDKGAILDWSDYFFLHYLPLKLRDPAKWPNSPSSCRELVGEYGQQVYQLCGKLMKILSTNLGMKQDYLEEAFGGEGLGACMRINYYPKCPQPELALGLSPHSDPGGLTILFPDENVPGLQVRHASTGRWITVKPIPNAFIVNLGDQIQVLSNGKYKSVEHRVIVNSNMERVSIAYFYNPRGDVVIQPAEELLTEEQPAAYPPTTYDQYRLYIRMRGPRGKSQVNSMCTSIATDDN